MDSIQHRRGTDDHLLEMLLNPHANLPTIAEVNGLSLSELCEWADRPRTRAALKALRRLHRTRAALFAAEARTTALRVLRAIADAHDDELRNTPPSRDPKAQAVAARRAETARKACHELLRTSPVAPGSRPEHRAPARSKDSPPPATHPVPIPKPAIPAPTPPYTLTQSPTHPFAFPPPSPPPPLDAAPRFRDTPPPYADSPQPPDPSGVWKRVGLACALGGPLPAGVPFAPGRTGPPPVPNVGP